MRAYELMPKCLSSAEDPRIYEMQAKICKSFANPIRLRILDLLAKAELTVTEIQQELNIAVPNVSQHLAVLKNAGVIKTRREGKQIYCSLAIPEVKDACQLVRSVLRAQIKNGRGLVA